LLKLIVEKENPMKPANVAVLLLVLAASAVSGAQVVKGRTLKTTTMQEGGLVTASCNSMGCEAKVPLVPPVHVVCPVATGKTCTFSVQVSSSVVTSQGALGLFRYTGDGESINGFLPEVIWQRNGTGSTALASFTFPLVVTNTKNNQAHRVSVDLVCFDINDLGSCTASTDLQLRDVSTSVRTDVFIP
jgi:hypothetical protein